MLNRHKDLTTKMELMGYESVADGACYGVAAMGVQAILSEDCATYNRRIELFECISSSELLHTISAAYEEWKAEIVLVKSEQTDFDKLPILERKKILKHRYKNLPDNTKLLLTIPAFLDGVRFYQHEPTFSSSNHFSRQNLLYTSSVIAPKVVTRKGGIVEVARFCGLYSEFDLGIHLRKLMERLIYDKVNFPVAFIIRTINHAFTIGYTPGDDGFNWTLIEASSGGSQKISPEGLAYGIMHNFSHDNAIALESVIYCTADNYQACNNSMNACMKSKRFIAIHKIDTERFDDFDEKIIDLYSLLSELFVLSVCGGYHDVLSTLLDKFSFDANYPIFNTHSALNITIANNDTVGMGVILKSQTANSNIIDHSGFSPLGFATLRGNVECIKLLMASKNINMNLGKEGGFSPIFIAAQEGFLDCLLEILKHQQVNINEASHLGGTALYKASANNHPDCVQALVLQELIDVNPRTHAGETPLFIAAALGNTDCVIILLSHSKIRPNEYSNTGTTPLCAAAANNHIGCVNALVHDSRVDINETHRMDMFTPLMLAVINGNFDVALILIESGADLSHKDYLGRTTLDIAESRSNDSMCELIRNHIASRTRTFSP